GRAPHVSDGPRECAAVHQPGNQGHDDEQAVRNGLDDLDVAEPPGHLHRPDGTVNPVAVPHAPQDGGEGDDPLDGTGQREGPQIRGPVRNRGGPGALGGLHGGPTAPDEHHDQQGRGAQQRPAPSGHPGPPAFFASHPSTSARYRSRSGADVASTRMTRTGWVLEARISPHPVGNVIRTPSSVETGYLAPKYFAARSTTSNFRSSGQSTRSSGVFTVRGRSASSRDNGPPSRAT